MRSFCIPYLLTIILLFSTTNCRKKPKYIRELGNIEGDFMFLFIKDLIESGEGCEMLISYYSRIYDTSDPHYYRGLIKLQEASECTDQIHLMAFKPLSYDLIHKIVKINYAEFNRTEALHSMLEERERRRNELSTEEDLFESILNYLHQYRMASLGSFMMAFLVVFLVSLIILAYKMFPKQPEEKDLLSCSDSGSGNISMLRNLKHNKNCFHFNSGSNPDPYLNHECNCDQNDSRAHDVNLEEVKSSSPSQNGEPNDQPDYEDNTKTNSRSQSEERKLIDEKSFSTNLLNFEPIELERGFSTSVVSLPNRYYLSETDHSKSVGFYKEIDKETAIVKFENDVGADETILELCQALNHEKPNIKILEMEFGRTDSAKLSEVAENIHNLMVNDITELTITYIKCEITSKQFLSLVKNIRLSQTTALQIGNTNLHKLFTPDLARLLEIQQSYDDNSEFRPLRVITFQSCSLKDDNIPCIRAVYDYLGSSNTILNLGDNKFRKFSKLRQIFN